ncbi:MAG: hypothetical protein KatS3mg043_2077 [Rhodothermaceae bacterium]|nr:MAG: hypothetical protein KatS3mg043_2077 [Rhodothermaceae bacterium]
MRWLPIVIGGLLALAAPAAAQHIEVLPPSGRWVTDNADLLSPAEERILSARLAGYADTTSTQIIIVTLPSLGGVPAADYAVELGRRWGVGQQGKDNGIVILVSRDDREVFIATGFGLEGAIPDAVAARIVRNIIIPHFRQGRFYDGLSAAVDALIQAAAGTFTAEPVPPLRPRRHAQLRPAFHPAHPGRLYPLLSGQPGGRSRRRTPIPPPSRRPAGHHLGRRLG